MSAVYENAAQRGAELQMRHAAPVTADEHASAVERWIKAIDAPDLIDELVDARDLLLKAAAKGDAALAGRIVVNVHRAYAGRLANGELHGTHDGVSAEQAAAMAVYGGVIA